METFITTQLARFDETIKPEALAAMAEKSRKLTVNGIDDKDGYRAVHDARMELKKARVQITKIGKDLRASATEFNRAVIARENELIEIINPEEKRLDELESHIDHLREEAKKEAERKEIQRIQTIVDSFAQVGVGVDFIEAKGMTEEQVAERLQEATIAFKEKQEADRVAREEQERQRKENEAKEAAQRKAEMERQEAERIRLAKAQEELERVAVEQRRREAELRAREDEIRAKEEAQRRQEEMERAKKEAAEKAVQEAEAKAKAEKEEEEQRLKFAEDSDRFGFLAQQIETSFINSSVWSHMKSKKGKKVGFEVLTLLKQAHDLCYANERKTAKKPVSA